MKTPNQLKALVTRAGGVLEEDEGFSDTRIFQVVAPTGKLWACDDLHCLVVCWARGNSDQAYRHNEEAYADVSNRLSFGLRDMTEEDSELYAED